MSPRTLAPRLTDGVVTLRAHSEDDLAGIVEACRDEESVRWTRVPERYTLDHAKTFVRQVKPAGWETNTDWAFAVEAADETGTPRFAGNMAIRNEGERRGEIAFLAHPWARGRGLMERAARLALDWGFAERDLETVVWYAHVGNWASRRLAWKVGFTYRGTLPAWSDQRGALHDTWVATLRRGEPMTPVCAWLGAPVIEGPSVRLRPLRDGDVLRIIEACGDASTRSWLGTLPDPYGEADARAFLEDTRERAAVGTAVTWAIADPADDRLLGVINIFDIRPIGAGEIGYWVHPDARGRGVATEASRLALRHGFIGVEDGGLGLRTIRAYTATDNAASARVLRTAGLREAGTARGNTVLAGGIVADTLAFDIVADEFDGDT